MRQKMRQILRFFCMIVCFFALTACGSKAASEPIPESIELGMKSGARNYLTQFDSYDDVMLADELKRMQRQKNTVMESAVQSWISCKEDLGRLLEIHSEAVERIDEDSYRVTLTAAFERRELEFVLTAEEIADTGYAGGATLVPTELLFNPDYTMGEKLARAAMNTALGMGTVFAVLIFISVLIGQLKHVNTLEASWKARKAAKEAKKNS